MSARQDLARREPGACPPTTLDAAAAASVAGEPVASPAGQLADPTAIRYDGDALVPVVVQDAADGRLLMVAWADAEAVDASLRTGLLHFHSRSRDRLWLKGETSGNVLRLRALALDCDGDTLLATVEPAGPACHRGTRSCFDPDAAVRNGARNAAAGQGFAWLETLWRTIAARAVDRPAGSYTARLLAGGVDAAGRKVTEEATEMLLAAKDDAVLEAGGAGRAEPGRAAVRAALAGEAADLLYHALVLLAERQMDPAAVIDELRRRHAG
jgi:phosphoribosyl-AMP cyclohydrolase / phosphoribosyl-ATP pyrophosphohydrolase